MKIPFDVVVEEKCTVVLVQDVTEKASAEPSALRRVEASCKATMCHRPKSKLPTALTWVPAEDADPLLPAQSVAGICAEGGGRIARRWPGGEFPGGGGT